MKNYEVTLTVKDRATLDYEKLVVTVKANNGWEAIDAARATTTLRRGCILVGNTVREA